MRSDGRVDWLAGGGELGALMRAHDWTSTALGSPETWPQSLKTSIRIMLTSRQPIWIGWGPELTYLYNDPYKSIIGGKHPWALGKPTSEVWREIWDEIGPMLDTALGGVEGTYVEQQLLIMERNGYPEETYYTFSYSPIPDDEGRPTGIICANTEDTRQVIGERQLVLLRELAAHAADARNWREACERSAEALAANPRDIPFAMLYMRDDDGQTASLVSWTGIEGDHPVAPAKVAVTGPNAWVLGEVLRAHEARVVDTRPEVADILPTGAWDRPSQKFALLPVMPGGESGRAGVLVVGLNPFRLFDDAYHGFLGLVAGQIAAAIANADAYEAESRRAEALAELDEAKTAFFSNVSHEFRTPLTLLLGPVEQILAKPEGQVLPDNRALLEVAHRNGLRLQKLVNTLLDFSRIEAGRTQARFEPTDLAAFTAELASNFRSATDRAGLALDVDCPPLPQPAYVDRDMWEKVVLNLLSNAFKFTFEGGIRVGLAARDGQAVLRVADTGVGVPAEELPRLFERFHRVEGARGRSHEGTGIGLALVQELVRLHGGEIEVESAPGRGTAFTVRIPLGAAHLPADQVSDAPDAQSPRARADAFVAEALRWLPDSEAATGIESDGAAVAAVSGPRRRIVLADDNADMRGYIRRLLSDRGYAVEAVADGEAALAAALAETPDLVLSDVMMPKLDGFGLLAGLRADERTREAPVILLSARAGEEAKIEGLEAGADDYLTKPFSARELFARVDSAIALAQVRREMTDLHRRQEKRQRFLLALGDRLRSLSDPAEQKAAAATALGEHLNAGRVGYVDVQEDGQRFHVGNEWTQGMSAVSETQAFADFGPQIAAGFQSGETLVADDIEAFPDFAAHRDAFAALAIRAFIAVPLVKHGRLSAILHVHEKAPRAWTEEEVALVQEVAERTWAAAEHSRAEARLQARNVDLERAFADLSVSSRRQRLLIHELNHRVKNTLATVQSMATQSLGGAASLDSAREAFEARLMSLSVAHNILTQESWEGADLGVLVVQTLRPFTLSQEARVVVEGPSVRLAPKAALALAMALHELATNASKYGALSNDDGRLSIRWSLDGFGDGATLRIVWSEAGGPPVVAPQRRGFGSRLIERGLAGELGGKAVLTFAPSGLVGEIVAPLARLTDDGGQALLEPAFAQ